jgi:hypothetical protein
MLGVGNSANRWTKRNGAGFKTLEFRSGMWRYSWIFGRGEMLTSVYLVGQGSKREIKSFNRGWPLKKLGRANGWWVEGAVW